MRPRAGQCGPKLLLWAENSAAGGICCRGFGSPDIRKALIFWGFSAGMAFAEHSGERVRAAPIAAIVGIIVMLLAFGAASSAIDSLFGLVSPKQTQSAGSGQDQPNLFAFQADAATTSTGGSATPTPGGGAQIAPETMSALLAA